MNTEPIDEIVKFWFEKLTPKDWYRKDPSIDAEIRRRFGGTYHELKSGVPQSWLGTPGWRRSPCSTSSPRNMFRGEARAFATDA